MQGKAQQAALLEVLLERQQSWPQIEKRLGHQSTVRAKHLYNAILLDDEFSSAAVGGLLQMQRRRLTFRNRFRTRFCAAAGAAQPSMASTVTWITVTWINVVTPATNLASR